MMTRVLVGQGEARMVMKRRIRCARGLIIVICRKTEDGQAEDCLPRRRGGRVSDEMGRGCVHDA